MDKVSLSKEVEEKRLKDFQKIAERWDTIPEYARGKLDGTISTIAALCGSDGVKKEDTEERQPVAV